MGARSDTADLLKQPVANFVLNYDCWVLSVHVLLSENQNSIAANIDSLVGRKNRLQAVNKLDALFCLLSDSVEEDDVAFHLTLLIIFIVAYTTHNCNSCVIYLSNTRVDSRREQALVYIDSLPWLGLSTSACIF